MKFNWPFFYAKRLWKEKRSRYRIGIFSICFIYLTLFLLVGLYDGVENGIKEKIFKRGDAYRMALSKKAETSSSMGIHRIVSPSFEEAYALKEFAPTLEVKIDFSFLLPNEIYLQIEGKEEKVHIEIIQQIPQDMVSYFSPSSIYVNQLMKEKLKEEENYRFFYQKEVIETRENYAIQDSFSFILETRELLLLEEYEFQNQPTVYFSYEKIEMFLKNHYAKNLSLFEGHVISWYDYLLSKPLDAVERNYQLLLFVDNQQDALALFTLFEKLSSSYTLSSSVYENYLLFKDIVKLIEQVILFVFVFSLFIFILLSIYLNYSFLLEDQHDLGILFALGSPLITMRFIYHHLALFMNLKGCVWSLLLFLPFSFLLSFIEKTYLGTAFFSFQRVPSLAFFLFLIHVLLLFGVVRIVFQYFNKKEIETLLKEED